MRDSDGLAPDSPGERAKTYRERLRTARREAILDAAGELMRTRGWGKTRMSDVAVFAGVGRTTLYGEFPNRGSVAQEALLREIQRLLQPFEGGLRRHPDDAELAISDAFQSFVEAVIANPLAQALVLNEHNEEILTLLTIEGTPAHEFIRVSVATFITDLWPHAPAEDADLLGDSIGRLGISVATLPGRAPFLTGHRVGRLLGPFAREVTATPRGRAPVSAEA